MRLAILVLVLSSVVLSATGADPPGGYYTTRYDHLDIENILNQKRLVHYYAACLLERGPCTPQGTEFKSILPEAIKTNCLRCTEKQRVVTTRTIKRLQKEYPDIWDELEQRWDPTGANVKRLLSSVNRPRPIIPLLTERFGDENQNNAGEVTTRSPTTSFTASGSISSTTPSSTIPSSTSAVITTSTTSATTTTTTTTTTATPSTTTSRVMYKPVTARPFNSIGVNLVVLNPKVILDKVLYTADAVLNTVSGVFKG